MIKAAECLVQNPEKQTINICESRKFPDLSFFFKIRDVGVVLCISGFTILEEKWAYLL